MTETQTEQAPAVDTRPVAPEDDDFLLDVYASTRADEMALVPWTQEQKRAFLKMQLDAQRAEYERRFPEADYRVILVAGRPAGRLWVARTPEQIRLLDIALLPEFRNRGAGALLLRRLTDESERTGLPLRHMVFQLNEEALRFYERLGFTRLELHGAYWEMEKKVGGER
ncbi:MAG TPA: GNAT family N-acetyltransferase [Pyrinomonadaceae bacterium]|nr:GNAT family N-acetyltransferase [Pyrinomonadaceae bacterium]